MKKIPTIIVAAGFTAATLAGCLSSSKNLRNDFNRCVITVNEAVGVDDPKYPRTLQIGVNDQMVEQGDETSGGRGNNVPVTTSLNLSQAEIEALKGLANVAKNALPPGNAEDCADGNCSD